MICGRKSLKLQSIPIIETYFFEDLSFLYRKLVSYPPFGSMLLKCLDQAPKGVCFGEWGGIESSKN